MWNQDERSLLEIASQTTRQGLHWYPVFATSRTMAEDLSATGDEAGGMFGIGSPEGGGMSAEKKLRNPGRNWQESLTWTKISETPAAESLPPRRARGYHWLGDESHLHDGASIRQIHFPTHNLKPPNGTHRAAPVSPTSSSSSRPQPRVPTLLRVSSSKLVPTSQCLTVPKKVTWVV
jgi:hypothetical protein